MTIFNLPKQRQSLKLGQQTCLSADDMQVLDKLGKHLRSFVEAKREAGRRREGKEGKGRKGEQTKEGEEEKGMGRKRKRRKER